MYKTYTLTTIFLLATLLCAPVYSLDTVKSDALKAAMERFHAVRNGDVKTVDQLNELKLTEEKSVATKRLKDENPPVDRLKTLQVEEKHFVKNEKVYTTDTLKGMAGTIMVHTRKIRTLGEESIKDLLNSKITLGEAIQTAIHTGYGLRIKKSDVKQAEVSVFKAWSQRLPSLDFGFTFTKMNNMEVLPGLSFTDDNQRSYKFGVQYPLYLFGKLKYALKAALAARKSAQEDYEYQVIKTAYDVKKVFYGILLAGKFVDVAEQSLNQISRHVKTVKHQYEVGMASRFDLLRVEVQRANTKPELIKTRIALKNARNSFNMLLGRSIETPFKLEGKLKAKAKRPSSVEEVLATALLQRQDLKKARKDLEAARAAYELAKRGKTPSLVYAYNYNNQWGGRVLPNHHWDESFNHNVVLNIPLLDKRATHADRKNSLENVKKAQVALEMIENQIHLDVNEAVNEMTQAYELILASSKNIEQAEEALNIANVSFENGLNTNIEVMDAQLALDQARTNYYQSVHDWLIAEAKMQMVTGTIGEL